MAVVADARGPATGAWRKCAEWVRGLDRHSKWNALLVVVVLSLASLAYFHAKPSGWTADYPLPWDMAHHYLRATQFADGVRNLDWPSLRQAVRGANSYPPGHGIMLGTWFVVFGSGVASWLAFGFLVCIGTTLLLFRIGGVFSVLAFLASPVLVSLTATLYIDSLAAMLLLATIVLFPQPASGSVVPTWRFVAFGAAITATILTKYNYGLPTIPAAILAACLSRNRRVIVGVAGACAAATAVLAGYLLWQDGGVSTLRRVAFKNRVETTDPPLSRLWFYVKYWVDNDVGSRPMAVALASLAVVGGLWVIIRQRPWARAVSTTRLAFALTLVAITLAFLSFHSVFQWRSVVGVAVVTFAAAGAVVKMMPTRARWACVGIALVLSASTLAFGKQTSQKTTALLYPERSRELAGLSEAVAASLQPGKPTRVTGTFAEFGNGWVTVLRNRNAPGLFVGFDPPYPLDPNPTQPGYPDQWSDKYAEIVKKWHADGVRRIIGLEIQSGSPYDNVSNQKWSGWKKNLILAARESPEFYLSRTTSFESGVNLYVFDAK